MLARIWSDARGAQPRRPPTDARGANEAAASSLPSDPRPHTELGRPGGLDPTSQWERSCGIMPDASGPRSPPLTRDS